MSRPEAESWYAHILAGQLSELGADKVFQFRRLDDNALGESPTYDRLCTTRHPESKLCWSPAEKLYALRVQAESESPGGGRRWSGLPLARLQQLYEPFNGDFVEAATTLSGIVDFKELVRVTLELEAKGPLHVGRLTGRTVTPINVFTCRK